jgi:long-subunit fatty acid transport protein
LGVFLKNSIPKTLLRTFAVSLLFVLSAAFSFAQNTATTVNGPGTTGAVALEIPVNPRAIAMGQAFTAVADDSSAVYWNPAGLNQMQGSELLAEYDVFINTVTYNYLNGAFKLGNDLTMGFGLKLLGSGLENIINSSGAATGGTFGETYYDIDIAAAYRLSYSLDIGITAKYITETLGTTSASTFAVDLGLMYKTPIPHLKLALDLQNLGPGIAFVQVSDPLPLIFKIGAAYQMFDDDFTMDLDVDFPNDNVVSTSLGGEYWYKNTLVGRLGYEFQGSIDQNQLGVGGEAGLYLGAGIKVSLFKTYFSFDYAWTDQGILGSNHHFSLAWYF